MVGTFRKLIRIDSMMKLCLVEMEITCSLRASME